MAEGRNGFWVVLKFGISTTSGIADLTRLADLVSRRRAEGARVAIMGEGLRPTSAQELGAELAAPGTDADAAALATQLGAARLEIWSDVPGLFSADPREIPAARLLRALHYDEAQEIAGAGQSVLHPRLIPPLRLSGIPVHLGALGRPDITGTVISAVPGSSGAKVKAVCIRRGVTLVSMESAGMWHAVGFLADAFAIFRKHGFSVDLVSTSETNVTVSLDPDERAPDDEGLAAVAADLAPLCRVQVLGPCASVSLVGRDIRTILHQLGEAFELFEEQKIYLVSQAANDLNFTFVVDERQGERLAVQLHELLIRPAAGDRVFGPTWEQLFAKPAAPVRAREIWWERKRDALLRMLGSRDAAYVYDRATVLETARALLGLRSVARLLYAMKANPHAELLKLVHGEGLGIECVSRAEIERVLDALPTVDRQRILFTPNFAPRAEYEWAYAQGVRVTIDNLYALEAWAPVFRDREAFVRIDPGSGKGHHQHVRTAGAHSKFGIPIAQLDALARLAPAARLRIVGLHAHLGSGNFDPATWAETGRALAALAARFPEVRVIDVGGGLGVAERGAPNALDLRALDAALEEVAARNGHLEFWLEPGRYLIAGAGVLLARVTQIKSKGEVSYVGVATGMNSLIRPALYGAHHEIVNLTRLDEPATELVNVVGPICESGDVLGHDRLLPPTREGDVLLIATAGAYGRAMASSYNLRAPADELWI
jgi:bifunctional diaminopimelate decarboxylase / aspartate kinase